MSKPRTGAPKRVAVGLLAGALAMFGVALAPQAGATATVTTERLAGATRYGTAAAIAANAAFAAPTTAIVATGENFPDALAASSLAGANAPAPIILTQTDTYTQEAKAGLAALKAKGVTALTIVGGTAAVSEDVETAIKGDGFTVARVAGEDRYETAAAIAAAADAKRAQTVPTGGLKTALIATGLNFPDALAGGPIAYANRLPLLLVNDTVPTDTANAISTLGIKKVIILGGTSAVSSAVEAQLIQATGNTALRLAGVNRYSTAAAIGDYEITTLGFPATTVILATGENFPDALAAGPLGGQLRAPIVLTTTATLSTEAQAFLDKYSSRINKIIVVGGTAAVTDEVVAAAKAAAQNTANDNAVNTTVTSRPELVSAAITSTVTPAQSTATTPSGTYVRYTFDEPILSVAFGNYKIYNANGSLADTGDAATIEADGKSVLVRFDTVNTTAGASALSVATVDNGAALDAQGNENPEGDAAIGTSSTSNTGGTAGTTAAPDLVSVGGFRAAGGGGASAATTIVDFTFDQAAFIVSNATVASEGATGFTLITPAGSEINCDVPASGNYSVPGGGSVTGGNGTATITATCPGAGLTAASIARGTVNTGAVAATVALGTTNELSAADTATPTTVTPDLVSATFSQGTATNGGLDQVIYTFDQPVNAVGLATLFCVYDATGAAGQVCSGTSPTINVAGGSTQVLVTFGATTLDAAVGASVKDGAVTASSGAGTNQQDEVAVANSGVSSSVTPGTTAAPDLTSVAISRAASDIFGNPGAFQATYTFDAKVATAGGAPAFPTRFYLFLADGTKLTASSCTVGSAATAADNTVVCTNAFTGFPAGTTTITNAVLGTVDAGAVVASSGGLANPEGGAPTTGGTGTAVNP